MKRLFTFFVLAVAIVAARADFVIKQKVESAMLNSDITMQIKGDKVRVDMGEISTIMDLSTGDTITLMHKQKTAMKVSGAQMMDAMRKQMGAADNAEPPKPQATGKTEKVGDYNTEIYTWSNTNGMTATMWVAKDFPNFKNIKEQLGKVKKSTVGGMSKGTEPDDSALPGMVVKAEAEVLGQKMTTTLISVKEESLDASLFEVPKDYQNMAQPAAMPGTKQPAGRPAAKQTSQAAKQTPAEPEKIHVTLDVGTKFPDFNVEDTRRNPLSLANYKGKVVLIDFWATWNAPSVEESPNVLKTYEKYHSKGFEVIGVSLDQEEAKLTAFTKQNKMLWPQFFDGQVWANKLAEKCGIDNIPAAYLLDGEGTIIAKDLRGDALEQAVAKALTKH
jgi:peroxiredoxin